MLNLKRKSNQDLDQSLKKKKKQDEEVDSDVIKTVPTGLSEEQQLQIEGEQLFRLAEEQKKNNNMDQYKNYLFKSYLKYFPDAILKMAKYYIINHGNLVIETKKICKTDLLKKLKLISKQSNKEALYYQGLIFEMQQQRDECFKAIKKSAALGHPLAQYKLARFYDYGQFVQQDRAQALEWYKLSSEQGVSEAVFKMGVMYHKGRGTPQNTQMALSYYQKAAELRQPNANYNIGNALFKGEMGGQQIHQDIKKAVEYLKVACELNHCKAQFQMGRLYALGEKYHVEKSYYKAEKIFAKSYLNKCVQALEPLTELKNINRQEKFLKQIEFQQKIFHKQFENYDYSNLKDIVMLVDHDVTPLTQRQVKLIITQQAQQQLNTQRNSQQLQ